MIASHNVVVLPQGLVLDHERMRRRPDGTLIGGWVINGNWDWSHDGKHEFTNGKKSCLLRPYTETLVPDDLHYNDAIRRAQEATP